jgi:hypothetical protein
MYVAESIKHKPKIAVFHSAILDGVSEALRVKRDARQRRELYGQIDSRTR